jgi:hypothetical protein
MLQRCDRLTDAIREAREQANSVEVTDVHPGDAIRRYLFVGDA